MHILGISCTKERIYLDWESRVARRARYDEGRSECVDLVQRQGYIEWRGKRALSERSTDV